MDEVIYLELDEEITSVIDKMKQSKATRLGLVVPKEATLLQSVINLRLLVREATNLDKEIALITADKIGRNLAAKVGLTVYDSVKNQQPVFQPSSPTPSREEVIEIDDTPDISSKEERPKGIAVHHFQEKNTWAKREEKPAISVPWQPPKNAQPPKEVDWRHLKKIIWPIVAIILILILIGAFLILPKVNVKLVVQAESFEKSTTSQISGDQSSNLDNNIFSGKLIDLTQEKEEKFSTTGKKNLGGKASGTITIYNNLDNSNHSFLAGAKLSSSSKTFVLKNNVTVPGAGVQSGKAVPGTVSTDIEAESAGEEYNVNAGRFTIVGLTAENQEFIYGLSSKDLTGGFSKVAQVVSQSDYDQAKTKITQELNDSLKKDLQDKAGDLNILENAIDINIVEENSTSKVDTEATDFTLKIKVRLREMVFSKAKFDQFIINIMEKQIPSTQMLSLGPNGAILPEIKEKKYDQGILNLDLKVSAKMSAKIDTEKVRDNLLGKSQSDSKNYLQNVEGLSSFDISYFPNFWPVKRIPNYRRNLTVTLDYLEPVSASPTAVPSPQLSPEASQ